MSEFFLTKTKDGYIPQYESDIDKSKKIGWGEEVKVNYRKTRNPGNHRRYFAMLRLLVENATKFDGSDMFKSVDDARWYMMVKTGNVDQFFVDDNLITKVKSIAFDEMEEEKFRELFDKSIDIALKDCIPGANRYEFERQILSFS